MSEEKTTNNSSIDQTNNSLIDQLPKEFWVRDRTVKQVLDTLLGKCGIEYKADAYIQSDCMGYPHSHHLNTSNFTHVACWKFRITGMKKGNQE